MPERELGQETLPLEPVSSPERSPAPAQQDGARAWVGRTLGGRFRLLRFLGRGGMGEVYEARDLVLQATVAVKTLAPTLGSDAAAVDRLRREVLLARRVGHPNVCRVHELHQDAELGGLTFISMEYLEGETLAQRLRRTGPVAVPEALDLVDQLAAGLGAIHREGLVHRDFKPGNVMLVGSGERQRAVVMDFGIARALLQRPNEASGPTETNSLGTPQYMAPEQLRGGELGPRTDVYAFGLVAREMVSGVAPAGSGVEPKLPAGWRSPIRRATATAPPRRFASPAELATSLRRGRRPAFLLAVGVGLLAAAIPLGIWLAPRTQALVARRIPLIPSSSARVAVVPVEGSPASAALADALRVELSLPGAVRANDEEEVWAALRKAQPTELGSVSAELPELLRATANSEHALLTSATLSGPEVHLALALHRTADGQRMGSTELTGAPGRLGDLANRAGAWARAALGLPALGAEDARRMQAAHPARLETAEQLATAKTLFRLGRATAALPLIEQVVAGEPRLAIALDAHADILEALGRHHAATEVRALAAESAQALPELLRLRVQQGYWDSMGNVSEASLGNPQEASPVSERLLALTPDDVPTVLRSLGKTGPERRARLESLRSAGSPLARSPLFDRAEAEEGLVAGEPEAALAAIDRGEHKLSSYEDRLRRVRLFTGVKTRTLRQLVRLDELLQVHRAAIEISRTEKEPFLLATILFRSANALWATRQWNAALETLRQHKNLLIQSGADWGPDDDLDFVWHVSYLMAFLGRLDDAGRELDLVAERHPREYAANRPLLSDRVSISMARGRIPEAQAAAGALEVLSQGRYWPPLLQLASALDDLPKMEALFAQGDSEESSGWARARLEDRDQAAVWIAEAKLERTAPAKWGQIPVPTLRTDGPGATSALLRLESRLALARGDLELAAAKANAALNAGLRYKRPDPEWDARLQLARVRYAQGNRTAAEETLRPLDPVRAGGHRQLGLRVDLVRAEGIRIPAAQRAAAQKVEREATQLGFRRIARLARELESL